jgi:hypothetical protein
LGEGLRLTPSISRGKISQRLYVQIKAGDSVSWWLREEGGI